MADVGELAAEDRKRFDELLKALATIFREEGRAGGDEAAEALEASLERPYTDLDEHDISEYLQASLDAEGAMPLVEPIKKAADLIPWHYSGLSDGRIASRYAKKLRTTYLIGPHDAAIHHPTVWSGLFFQEPGLEYPSRTHAAEETFYIISGTGEWSVDNGPRVERHPGEFVYHRSNIPHYSVTTDSPILTAWRWTGEISMKTYKLHE